MTVFLIFELLERVVIQSKSIVGKYIHVVRRSA